MGIVVYLYYSIKIYHLKNFVKFICKGAPNQASKCGSIKEYHMQQIGPPAETTTPPVTIIIAPAAQWGPN
jgi:hypothetical protein